MKNIVLGVTALGMREMTAHTVGITAGNMDSLQSKMILIDNASSPAFLVKERSQLIHNKKNLGSFYPLKQLYDKYPDADIIGIMHNDCAIYEKGWDERLSKMFELDKKLGAVGLFGWQKVDKFGIDHNPIGNSFEESKPVIKYKRVTQLTPALTLDSMCMFFRRSVIPLLDIQKDMMIRHGYDKIWPMRLREHGYKTAVSGFSFQHKGQSMFEDPDYMKTMKKSYDARWNLDFPVESIEGMMLFEARVRFVEEFKERKNMLPMSI